MSDPDNIVLEMLRGLRSDIATFRNDTRADLNDIKERMLTIERGIGGMKRDSADLFDDHARQQSAIDRIIQRIEILEKRLEIQG